MKSKILQLAAHVLVLSAMSASAAIRFVNVNSASPAPPYTNWSTAAITIQDAVDAAVAGDQILVTNGVYQTGGPAVDGTLNRVSVNKAVTIESVNGAAVTLIQGSHVMGCVYLSNEATLTGFTLTNGFVVVGGGASGGTLNNCTLTGNSALEGGGASGCTLNNCVLTGNSAGESGGGAVGCTLNNCTLSGNSARFGGGAAGCTLNNCTLTGNSAFLDGGGASGCTLNNCVVYYNNAPSGDNYSDSSLSSSRTTPLPPGLGNISAEPQLVDLSHLSAGSPCRGAGSAAYSSGLDIDGETWANPPSMGCDEYHPGSVTGPLSVSIEAAYTNVAVGFALNFTEAIDGHATANRWEFGDGTVVSNRPYAQHSWSVPGDYSVVFREYNDTYPGGVSATVTVHVMAQPVHYVALSSANPVAPYTSWATAANNIQDVVDAASVVGALVLVTNGVYETGGRVVFGAMTNRVAVNKPVTVQSVNGAAVTVIRGFQVPGTTTGNRAIRCVYLTNGAALGGFTLTNGATRGSGDGLREQSGGGVWCESASAIVSNCVLAGNSARGDGGGAAGGTLNNCTLSANSGGGASGCTLNNCTLTGNSGLGGAINSTLNDCALNGNSADVGGGASDCTLNNCTLTGNRGLSGGGAYACTLYNCVLTGNMAGEFGGGALSCTLNNCTLSGNSARFGGGAIGATLNNCTLIGNSADEGGGAHGCTLNNCIAYYNSTPNGANGDNYSDSFFTYSCTTPLPPGLGNINAEPQLADLSHLSAGSPCRGAGSSAYTTGLDIDGESWANPPSIGCDEYVPGSVTGPLNVSIKAAYTNVAVGFAVSFTAAIDGHATANQWTFGDGTKVSNRLFAPHSWAVAGDYLVVFQAYNDTYTDGITATVMVHVVAQPVHYVALGSANPVAPYTSWATAATNIQDAADAASLAGALVLVTNGVYQTGERVASEAEATPNRVDVTKALMMRSVNGAAVTVIHGEGAVRCVYLANGAALVGFTLTNGFAGSGGGVWCESTGAVVSNCVLTGNSAPYNGGGGATGGTLINCTLNGNSGGLYGNGGGAAGSTLYNCTLSGNSAPYYGGGGAYGSTLYNCTLSGNSARTGGGAYGGTLNNCTLTGNSASLLSGGGGAQSCTLNNCIVYYNSASNGTNGDNYSDSILSYSCTTPLPTNGIGNFSSAPLFVNQAGGDLRLQSNSPCINAGSNASVPAGPDLAGQPRIAGGTVDIGAYEFQSPQSLISYAWLQQYALPIDGSADNTDADADGLNNWQEWRTGTNPTNALSLLRLLSPTSAAPGVIMSWQSVSGLNYFLERGTDLGAQPPFLPLATNIIGQPGTTTFTDTNGAGAGPFFYRVGIQE